MPTSIRILAFALGVAVAGGIGWAVGDAAGPEAPSSTTVEHEHTETAP